MQVHDSAIRKQARWKFWSLSPLSADAARGLAGGHSGRRAWTSGRRHTATTGCAYEKTWWPLHLLWIFCGVFSSIVTRKGALNEPEDARAFCWCRRRAQGPLARAERLQGGRPARLDAEVCCSGKDGMSAGAPAPLAIACVPSPLLNLD